MMYMTDTPADILQQLNELMKRLMEQGLKEQDGPMRPFAYGFKIIINDASTTEESEEGKGEGSEPVVSTEPSPEGDLEPIAEMYTTDDDVTVAIDLPGVERESIHLSLSDGNLTIIAGGNQLTSIEMPAVDADSMKSRYKHGVLEVKFSRGKAIRID